MLVDMFSKIFEIVGKIDIGLLLEGSVVFKRYSSIFCMFISWWRTCLLK